MKLNKTIKLLLFLVMISLLIFIPTSIKASLDSLKTADYSKPGSLDSKKYSTSEFLNEFLGYTVTTQEKEYLGDTTFFAYEDKVSTNNVEVSVQNNNLVVSAKEYSYKDANDNTITWYPKEASYNTKTLNFEFKNNEYKLIFDNLNENVDDLQVTYSLKLTIPKESINSFINACYNEVDAYVASGIIETKEKEYNAQLALYNQYVSDCAQYDIDLKAYKTYKENYKVWKAANEKYQTYLIDYAQYENDLANYNDYLVKQEQYNTAYANYQNYLQALEEYNSTYPAKKAAYDAYLPSKKIGDYRLSIMNIITTSMTDLERTIYWAVLGDTVTTVLAQKAELVELNADEEVIDDAEKATYKLRTIFTEYFGISSDKDKYVYYTTNYSQIKQYLELLLRSLDKLYRSGLVKKAIEIKGKTDKYLILVAQLALVCNAIDDNPVKNYEYYNGNAKSKNAAIIDDSWTIGDKTINQILGKSYFTEDSSIKAYPDASYTYPDPVDPPADPPAEVANPGLPPTVVKKPVEPEKVENPGEAPTEVLEPTKPTEVTAPVAYVVPENMQKLLAVYNTDLVKRDEVTEDYIFTKEFSFAKKIWDLNTVSVEFYDDDNTFLGKYITDSGSYIVYEGNVPSRKADEVYKKYTFVAWEYEDHTKLDFNNVTVSGKVHPVFEGTYREYNVAWFVDGNIEYQTYIYGETPTYTKDLYKEPLDGYYYIYKSWDKEIVPVTKDAMYVALYDEYPIVTIDDVKANYQNSDGEVTIDVKKNETGIVNISLLKDFYEVDKIILSGKSYKLSLVSTEYDKLLSDGVTSLSVSFENKGDGEYYYNVFTYNNDTKVNNSYECQISYVGSFDVNHSYLFLIDENNEEKEVNGKISTSSIEFTINTAYEYHVYPLYSINVSSLDLESLNLSKTISRYNCEIELSLKEEEPGLITKIKVADSKGNEIKLENGLFVMPKDDVYVVVSSTYIEYLVQFIVEGQIISSKSYHYGDTIEVPNNPSKLNDEKYSYTFKGWDKEITIVTEDIDYTAIFNSEELTIDEDPTEPADDDKPHPISKIRIAKIVIACVGGASILSIVFIVFRVILKKSHVKRIKG